jgi:hypothetical protein
MGRATATGAGGRTRCHPGRDDPDQEPGTGNQDGKIVHAAIHHRPLGPALRFSAELRERLAGAV